MFPCPAQELLYHHLSFGAAGTEMDVVVKGSVVRTERAEGSAWTPDNHHNCYGLRAKTWCLPGELPIGAPTILHSFVAFMSGNACTITNHKTIKIIPMGIYWLLINYCLCFVDTKWTHIVPLKETEFTHSWWCNFKWSNNSKEKMVLFVHFNSVQRDNKTSKGIYRLRWNSKCSICTKHTEGEKKEEGESIWDTTAIFHTASWKCLI